MARIIRFHEAGGPDVLRWEEVELPSPGVGEVRLRQTAIGLNFIDTYHRTGYYPVGGLPSGLGVEAAGVVEEVGPDAGNFEAGDRVAYAGGPIGAYATERVIPSERLVKVPPFLSDEQAAALMLKGLTVHYLVRLCYCIQPNDTILVHAAAGGVGLLLCQWAKHLGATVIGTVGSEDKASLASAHGCDYPIRYDSDDFVARVRDITDGRGVPVVYDSVGRDTFHGSLKCLQRRGLMVTFGQASGPVPPLGVHELTSHGSLFLTRPTLADYTATREELNANAAELFEVVQSGAVRVEVGQRYPLENAAQAHADLEARKTRASTILTP